MALRPERPSLQLQPFRACQRWTGRPGRQRSSQRRRLEYLLPEIVTSGLDDGGKIMATATVAGGMGISKMR